MTDRSPDGARRARPLPVAILALAVAMSSTVDATTASCEPAFAPGPATPRAALAQDVALLDATEIAPGVHVLRGGADGNVLVLAGATETLVVDGQAAAVRESVQATVASVADAPVRWVVTTHFHPDHVGANAVYAAGGATVVAHEACREEMTRRSEVAAIGWTIEAAPEAAWPTLTYADRLDLHVAVARADGESTDGTAGAPDAASEVVELHHLPAAHTAGDTAVRLRHADVIHTGDVLELGAYPFLDIWHGGTLDGLVAAVDRLLELGGPDTRYVPGHGPVADRAEVEAYRAMLAALQSEVRDAIAAGTHAEDFLASGPMDDVDPRWGSAKGAARLATYAFVQAAPEELVRARDDDG